MSGPEVRIDLGRIHDNVAALVELLGQSSISLTAVTKAVLGLPAFASTVLDAGAVRLGDSRIENVERLRRGGVTADVLLLRSPMPSQVDRVVRAASASCNTEPAVLEALSRAATAAGVEHGIVLMVELGDLREGILPVDLHGVVDGLLPLPGLRLAGIGTNLACRSGVVPDARNMAELSALADAVEVRSGHRLDVVSGGNSANLDWLSSRPDTGRIDDLRIGEAVLLGCEPLHRRPVPGLHGDAVEVRAEVIESKRKPSRPTGTVAETAFGIATPTVDRGEVWQTIVALGHQDVDPAGLVPPEGSTILGASSDHLVLETDGRRAPGTMVAFAPGYGALLRAMTSPFVACVTTGTARTVTAPPAGRSAPVSRGGRSAS